MLIFILK